MLDRDRRSQSSDAAPDVSIVVPLYNEVDALPQLHERIVAAMAPLGRTWELVMINDGSTDGTGECLAKLAAADPHIVAVELARNAGQTSALSAGFDTATGRVVVAMDGDLQHDPAEIPNFLDGIDRGYDLVSGWRKNRVDGPLRKIPSRIANWIIGRISGVQIHDFGTTFKAYRRELLDGLRLYGDMHRYIPAVATQRGARICEVPIKNIPRPHGKSNYGIGRTFGVMLDLIALRFFLKYLHRPLRFFGKLALYSWAISFLLGLYVLGDKLIYGVPIFGNHGPLAGASFVLLLMGTVFIATGLIGEILVRIYHEGTGRTTYVIRTVTRRETPSADTAGPAAQQLVSK
ncbi:MAG: Dodecaprenyl-phosphate galacturonate synthase [Phycisphaerae bacterium]|nr:Dodecaprenyl-phosphate galacturonate synthase [Phycisphaerae bacterium]